MSKAIILIGTPVEGIPAGGFIRDAKVLPYFSKVLRARGFSTVIYVPVNSIASAIRFSVKGGSDLGEAFETVVRDLCNGVRRSGVEAPLLDEAIAESLSALKWELNYGGLFTKVVSRALGFGYAYVYRIKRVEERLLKRFLRYVSSGFDGVSFIYSMNENIERFISLTTLAEKLRLPAGIMLQLPLYTYTTITITSSGGPRLTVRIANQQLNSYSRMLFIAIVRRGFLKLIQAVSPAPLVESHDLVDIARRYGVRISIPVPGNAFHKEILEYRSLREKEPVAVYFGRLSPDKGLYDLLYVWSYVEKALPKARLMLIGSFTSERVERRFNELSSKLGLRNVEYLGYFKHREELYRHVAEAKVLVYPSHQDSFSLTMLEAVALGLLCVAYSIPALRYIYKDIPSVTLVRKGDIEGMSRAVVRALRMSYDEYLRVQTSPKLLEFLEAHGSWERVAIAELNGILRYLG